MNGEVCCILGVCCPAGSVKQRDALAEAMDQDLGATAALRADGARSVDYAAWILDHFDLAPKGTLGPLLQKTAALARSHR